MASSALNKRLKSLGLSKQYYKQKSTEDRETFIGRMAEQMAAPKGVLRKTRGDIPLIGALYGLTDDVVKGVIKRFELSALLDECTRLGRAEELENRDIRAQLDREELESLGDSKDKRITRDRWPTDPEAKSDAIHDYLSVALVQYGSDEVLISERLSLPVWEITAAIKANPALQEAQQVGMGVAAAEAQSNPLRMAREGNNPTAAKLVLTNFSDGRWPDRQDHTVRHEGFAPPSEAEQGTVLDMFVVDGGKEESSE